MSTEVRMRESEKAARNEGSAARIASGARAGVPERTSVRPSPVLMGSTSIGVLARGAGNRAVATLLAASHPVVQRTPETRVIAALDDKGYIFNREGDFKTAWGILNSLSMTDMLTTMLALANAGRLRALTDHVADASSFDVNRLTVGFTAVRLKLAGQVDDPARVAALAALVGPIGAAQVAEVEGFLALPRRVLADSRAGVVAPDAAAAGTIRSVLEPAAAGGVVAAAPVAWDGDPANPAHVANRAALKRELTAALQAHLARAMPRARRIDAAPKAPVASFEGAGLAAKAVVDSAFSEATGQAAVTPGQQASQAAFRFRSGTELLDLTNPAHYTPDPTDVAGWMAETDAAAASAANAHHFESTRTTAEKDFLTNEVIAPFVAAHNADLAIYDKTSFAITIGRQIRMVPVIAGNTTVPATGGPSPAERAARWSTWKLLVHEYIHTLEHPAFSEATRGRRVMIEGFCELFTREVLRTAIPRARGGDKVIQARVEGTDARGNVFPGFTPALIRDYDSGQYTGYLANVDRLVGVTSLAAAKAAYFQGHVELIGLTPAGAVAAPAVAGTHDLIPVPAGITSVLGLAVALGSTTAAILGANPGMTAATIPTGDVHVPGAGRHTLVESKEEDARGLVMDRRTESPDQVANQHGIDVAALRRANPGFAWATAGAGTVVRIPVH
jgi:hypothetical protein